MIYPETDEFIIKFCNRHNVDSNSFDELCSYINDRLKLTDTLRKWRLHAITRAPKDGSLFEAKTKNNGTIICYGNEYGYFDDRTKSSVIVTMWRYIPTSDEYEEHINSLHVSIASRDYTISSLENDAINFAKWINQYITESDISGMWYCPEFNNSGTIVTNYDCVVDTDGLYKLYKKHEPIKP
jgi:hypothetical protein